MSKAELYAIPENIKAARLRARITGAELAEKADICVCNAYNIEKKPKGVSWKTARRVASALNLDDIYECFSTVQKGV